MTLGELRRAVDAGLVAHRSVRDELRDNLARRLRDRRSGATGDQLFPGIIGYDDTVIPQLINAILSRHHFILLGLRGQAKSRILRSLVGLLDESLPVVPGCEINDDPLAPLSAYGRARVAEEGDALPIQWIPREARYIEKLATPDVTIADMIGDIDPIKAAKGGLQLGSELAMHFGLMPRANRGIFAINELPDLAGKIQVGLFNVLQEGDVQIKGFPVRLPLDIMVVFSANPEDYTARGKIITPLKDRIGAEIRTHYLESRADAMAVTAQEAWTERDGGPQVVVPPFVRELIEEISVAARESELVDQSSGVSARVAIAAIELLVSNLERRALATGDAPVWPRVCDLPPLAPAITGKLEMVYEGEQQGPELVVRKLVGAACAKLAARKLHVVIDHDAHELPEVDGRLPAEHAARLRRIAHQAVDFGRAVITRVYLNVLVPIQVKIAKSLVEKIPHRMAFARRYDEISGLVGLHDRVHSLYVIARVSPIAPRFQISHIESLL